MQVINGLPLITHSDQSQPKDLLERGVSFDEFKSEWERFISSGRFEWFITGNIDAEEALQIVAETESEFSDLKREDSLQRLQHT